MKFHSDTITEVQIYQAMSAAKEAGKVTSDIEFFILLSAGSRTRKRGWEIQLGTYNRDSLPGGKRHYKNSGYAGAGNLWAASYDEWGWFIAELFDTDRDAIFGPYKGVDSFNNQTKNQFLLEPRREDNSAQSSVSYGYITRLISDMQ